MKQPEALMQPDWPEGATLLLGIGAQKAGTSWVHAMLRDHPDCVHGPMKELHYFDAVFGLSGGMRSKRDRVLAELEAAGHGNGHRARRLRMLDRAVKARDPQHREYLALVAQGLKPGQVALDITPSYGRAGDEGFAQMAAIPQTRFLLLLREPVARLWSALRMEIARQDDGAAFEATCREGLDRALAQDAELLVHRADYAATLRHLTRHVPAPRRLVMFFETLFTQGSLDRLHAFLGLSPRPMGDGEARNVGQPATMRPDQAARLTEIFRPQYDAVCATFGDAVPDAWHRRFAPSAAAA